jgi:hypothetical protein
MPNAGMDEPAFD